ncbi:rubrerythrin-like domain-containing protein [Halopenitus persicus]|uniref:DUF7129 domain-containing protein n=1 Tax=Halopenitus persicus TaxID=1048396 RepID=A0A1H3EPA8_9EURY|nr:rubrerythrin-like domain-containing protein [Halopenitus persicus]QHS17642.1 rubrerythrin-like domain-containing protein [haloarchaeon 3A1-DGR]SDX80551.1 hypothetical protein SAMN05216564_101534 [Halopenitus persicus]
MRPKTDVETESVYECFDCLARTVDPETPTCDDCGGDLWHIGRSRDM